MNLAEKISSLAASAMKNNAVIISAATFEKNLVTKLQLYFQDEKTAAMDIIKRQDLIDADPDEIYIINPEARNEQTLLLPVFITVIDEQLFLKINPDDSDLTDNLGNIPSVAYLEAVEFISNLKF